MAETGPGPGVEAWSEQLRREQLHSMLATGKTQGIRRQAKKLRRRQNVLVLPAINHLRAAPDSHLSRRSLLGFGAASEVHCP